MESESRVPFKALPLNKKIFERAPTITETYKERKSAPPVMFKEFNLSTDKRHS